MRHSEVLYRLRRETKLVSGVIVKQYWHGGSWGKTGKIYQAVNLKRALRGLKRNGYKLEGSNGVSYHVEVIDAKIVNTRSAVEMINE